MFRKFEYLLMGQQTSSVARASRPEEVMGSFIRQRSSGLACARSQEKEMEEIEQLELIEDVEYISQLPDECLAYIFQKLESADRNQCSLVCKRWHWVEAQGRQRLSLLANTELGPVLPALLCRFQHLTKLALRCDRKAKSINDTALFLVGRYCLQLKKLKLKGCKQLTDEGIERFSKICSPLRKISCGSCSFGARGVNSILRHCSYLEDFTVKRLRGLAEGPSELIEPGCCKLRRLCLKELYNAQLFAPLIAGSKNLHTLTLCKNSGNWDKIFEIATQHIPNLVELHMERLHLSDRGLHAVSKCNNLEVLHVVKTPECTSLGLSAVAEGCRRLRKLHLDGWKSNRIGDNGLISVAWKCKDLQELVLIGINATAASLGLMAANCLRLERLALCSSDTVGDLELSCIIIKCHSLKRLCIKGCPITDQGMQALATGCPDLVKVKVKKCRGVTAGSAAFLLAHRPSLIISLDSGVLVVESEIARITERTVPVARSLH
eukprot:c27191_g1_i1 orf=322-1800(+)